MTLADHPPRRNPFAERPWLHQAVIAANDLGLTRDERHELTEWLFDQPGSWSLLDEHECELLARSLRVFHGISYQVSVLRNGPPPVLPRPSGWPR